MVVTPLLDETAPALFAEAQRLVLDDLLDGEGVVQLRDVQLRQRVLYLGLAVHAAG
jgi:hypothetical protein